MNKFENVGLIKKLQNEDIQIYPVIKSKDGEILDGFHRKKANPDWKEVVIDVDEPIEKLKWRIKPNIERRDVTWEEKHDWYLKARKLLSLKGIKPTNDAIAKVLNIPGTTIDGWEKRQEDEIKTSSSKNTQPLGFAINRPITPYGEGMFFRSEKFNKDSRKDAYFIIKDGEPYPTLKRRSWFYHEDGREFSLREYAKVQEFPDDFKFVGNKEAIKNQIGNAVPPTMAEHVAKQIPPSNAIELFAGAGGMALGFEKSGHKVIWANEIEKNCCYTYRTNFPDAFINNKPLQELDIKTIKNEIKQSINLIFGGVPCQGFSTSGHRFVEDERNKLYKEFIRVVDAFKPEHFVMENVVGIMKFKDQIIDDMKNIGYDIKVEIIKGEQIGMRQKRHRVFFIGEKNEIGTN